MRRAIRMVVGLFFLLVVGSSAHAINGTATITSGAVVVKGSKAASSSTITWEGQLVMQAKKNGAFEFSTTILPQDCVGQLSDGVASTEVVVKGCAVSQGQGAKLLATGQTTAYQADKKDGIDLHPVNVPDDGSLKLGAPLQYQDNGDGTITDLNTGLMWEKKLESFTPDDPVCPDAVPANRNLHCANNQHYLWSGNGTQETIWDWLDAINAEGGTGYAGYNDWRIPNVQELLSILDYGNRERGYDPIFGFIENFYWSSTTPASNTSFAWVLGLNSFPSLYQDSKASENSALAVRGGS